MKARENFQEFLELWKDADPGLPEVEHVRDVRRGRSRYLKVICDC